MKMTFHISVCFEYSTVTKTTKMRLNLLIILEILFTWSLVASLRPKLNNETSNGQLMWLPFRPTKVPLITTTNIPRPIFVGPTGKPRILQKSTTEKPAKFSTNSPVKKNHERIINNSNSASKPTKDKRLHFNRESKTNKANVTSKHKIGSHYKAELNKRN